MRALLLAGLGLAMGGAACSGSGGNTAPLLASTTIGPEGGVLAVTSGVQQGLVLTVPAGAVDKPTVFAVRDEQVRLPPQVRTTVYATSYALTAGLPFRIEPVDLVLDVPATLRMPYLPGRLAEYAPGNVVARQQSPYATWEHVPAAIDVVEAWLEFDLRTLGSFQVWPGPRVERILDYVPPVGTVATLTDGYEFVVEDVAPGSPFAPQGAVQWRITGPGILGAPAVDDRLIFVGEELVARESQIANWRETWTMPYSPWLPVAQALGNGLTTTTQLAPLVGSPSFLGGQVSVFGYRQYSVPRTVDGRLVLDVLKLVVELAWNRPDIGVGQRQYVFWFAPEVGLLELSQDGVLRPRVP